MPTHVRVYLASGRVVVFTAVEYSELPSVLLVGARTQWLFPGTPLDAAGRD